MIYLCSGMQGQAHSAKILDWCMMECAGSHVGKEKTINFKAPSILFTLYLCRYLTWQASPLKMQLNLQLHEHQHQQQQTKQICKQDESMAAMGRK